MIEQMIERAAQRFAKTSSTRSLLRPLIVLAATALISELVRRARTARQSRRSFHRVDLARYAGKWYEIARIPYWYERDCYASTAEYTLTDGRKPKIKVVNACHKGSLDGPVKEVHGTARVADPETNARLKVRFGLFASGDYWIVELAPDYRYAVVGTPDRSKLWILSRTPTMDEDLFDRLVARAEEEGFDTTRLIRTPQPAETAGVMT